MSWGKVPSLLALPLWRTCLGCTWRVPRPGGLGQDPEDGAGGELGPHRGGAERVRKGPEANPWKPGLGGPEEPALITCLPTISMPVPSACPADQMSGPPATLSSDRPRVSLWHLQSPPKKGPGTTFLHLFRLFAFGSALPALCPPSFCQNCTNAL